MNDVQVCFRHVSSMLQVEVCSGMFHVYVTSLNILQGQICYKGLSAICFKGLSAICYKGFMPYVSRALVPYVTRALCHMIQGP